MESSVGSVIGRWAESVGIDRRVLPDPESLERSFGRAGAACRPGISPREIAAWEARHGFPLPRGLRAWLVLSNGFYRREPLIHPLSAIGPMVPFARMPGLVVQPESWFELGNPPTEPICIDLAYRWPSGDCPIFTSGDDEQQSVPRVIAASFETWFVRLLHAGGREFWFEPGFTALGDPWREHQHRVPAPPLPRRLQTLAPRVRPWMRAGADERAIAVRLGIAPADVEAIFRHLQHTAG